MTHFTFVTLVLQNSVNIISGHPVYKFRFYDFPTIFISATTPACRKGFYFNEANNMCYTFYPVSFAPHCVSYSCLQMSSSLLVSFTSCSVVFANCEISYDLILVQKTTKKGIAADTGELNVNIVYGVVKPDQVYFGPNNVFE